MRDSDTPPPWLQPVCVAGGTLLGLQALRALFPLLVYVARDRFGLSSVALGGIGAALFATAFVVPWLVRRGPAPRVLGTAVLWLAGWRGALQVWSGDPAGSLILAAGAAVAFLGFLAAVARGGTGRAVVPAVLLGAALDASLHAAAGTRDLHWGGVGATASALVPLLVTAVAAVRLRRTGPVDEPPLSGPALLAWGPWLLLHLEWLGNVARLSSRTGDATAVSGAWIAGGLAVAALVADRAGRHRSLAGGGLPLLAAAALVPSLVRAESVGPLAPVTVVVAQAAAALLLARTLERTRRHDGPGAASLACGGGFLAFLILVFAHYAGYDLPLPGSRLVWLGVAAAMLLGAAALSRPAAPSAAPPGARSLPIPVLVGGIALLALAPRLRPPPADPAPALPGASLRAITFNLHNGFDEEGRFALDGMLERVAAESPDVVALQEVSRGWLVNGSADLYELTRERLEMHGAFGPAVSTDWGNAVFSRFRPDSVRAVPLPPRDLPLTRQATIVDLPAGPSGVAWRVVGTHFHHRERDEEIRAEHATHLAATLGAPRGAILLGDFNAEPESATFTILREAGWTDAGAADPGPFSPTYPARAPVRRIDTILVGRGSRARTSSVPPAWGSDHRAVIAELEP